MDRSLRREDEPPCIPLKADGGGSSKSLACLASGLAFSKLRESCRAFKGAAFVAVGWRPI
jgi:hypothetical protein